MFVIRLHDTDCARKKTTMGDLLLYDSISAASEVCARVYKCALQAYTLSNLLRLKNKAQSFYPKASWDSHSLFRLTLTSLSVVITIWGRYDVSTCLLQPID